MQSAFLLFWCCDEKSMHANLSTSSDWKSMSIDKSPLVPNSGRVAHVERGEKLWGLIFWYPMCLSHPMFSVLLECHVKRITIYLVEGHRQSIDVALYRPIFVFIYSVGRFDRQVQCLISSWQFPSRLEPPSRRRSGVSRQTWETAIKDSDSARPHKKWSQNCMSCLQ